MTRIADACSRGVGGVGGGDEDEEGVAEDEDAGGCKGSIVCSAEDAGGCRRGRLTEAGVSGVAVSDEWDWGWACAAVPRCSVRSLLGWRLAVGCGLMMRRCAVAISVQGLPGRDRSTVRLCMHAYAVVAAVRRWLPGRRPGGAGSHVQ